MSLPWFFKEDQSPSLVVNAPSSLFSIGNQLAHNSGLDLCGGVPCELTREVVCDTIVISVSSRHNAPTSRLRDTTQELAVH